MTYKYKKYTIRHSKNDEKTDIDEIKLLLKSRLEQELDRKIDYSDFANFSIVFNASGKVPVIHSDLYLDDTLIQIDIEWNNSKEYEQ